jgi:hypothetical protein
VGGILIPSTASTTIDDHMTTHVATRMSAGEAAIP